MTNPESGNGEISAELIYRIGEAWIGGADSRAYVPAMPLEALGDPAFCRDHGLRYPYVTGAMANTSNNDNPKLHFMTEPPGMVEVTWHIRAASSAQQRISSSLNKVFLGREMSSTRREHARQIGPPRGSIY